jgi:hypothetical protein
MLTFVIVAVVLAIVVFVISSPWRPALHRSRSEPAAPGSSSVAELEAAREAKYAEIREAELDHRMGKLSDQDFEAVDRSLRAEAIEILRALDQAGSATIGER